MTVGKGWSKTWTFFEGEWHEGNVAIMGPRTHGAWLASTVFDGARAYDVNKPFEGIITNLERRYKETDSEWTRDEIGRFMTATPCEACGGAHLKVILETGELGSYDVVRQASEIAMAGGADFIKTSTGKVQPAATPAVTLVMLGANTAIFFALNETLGLAPVAAQTITTGGVFLLNFFCNRRFTCAATPGA